MKAICKGGTFRTAKGNGYVVYESGKNWLKICRIEDGKFFVCKLADFRARVASGQYTVTNRDGK